MKRLVIYLLYYFILLSADCKCRSLSINGDSLSICEDDVPPEEDKQESNLARYSDSAIVAAVVGGVLGLCGLLYLIHKPLWQCLVALYKLVEACAECGFYFCCCGICCIKYCAKKETESESNGRDQQWPPAPAQQQTPSAVYVSNPTPTASNPITQASYPSVAPYPTGVAPHPIVMAPHPTGVATYPKGIAIYPTGMATYPTEMAPLTMGASDTPSNAGTSCVSDAPPPYHTVVQCATNTMAEPEPSSFKSAPKPSSCKSAPKPSSFKSAPEPSSSFKSTKEK